MIRKRFRRQHGQIGSRFMFWAVICVLIVSLTAWAIRYAYYNEYAPSDLRGVAGKMNLLPPPDPVGQEESPAPAPKPGWADFEKASAPASSAS